MSELLEVFVKEIQAECTRAEKGEKGDLKRTVEKLDGLAQQLNKDGEAIIALGKDYIVQVKDNQPKLKKLMEEWFVARMSKEAPAAVEVKKKARRRGAMGIVG